jgi:hypothetical protein
MSLRGGGADHDVGTAGSCRERLWFYPRPRDDVDSIADCLY